MLQQEQSKTIRSQITGMLHAFTHWVGGNRARIFNKFAFSIAKTAFSIVKINIVAICVGRSSFRLSKMGNNCNYDRTFRYNIHHHLLMRHEPGLTYCP